MKHSTHSLHLSIDNLSLQNNAFTPHRDDAIDPDQVSRIKQNANEKGKQMGKYSHPGFVSSKENEEK